MDNKKKTGRPDRQRVSASEPYEVAPLVKKFELPATLVKKVIKQEGPMRKDVETTLRRMKGR